ncbi:MAG: hypothetical protein ACRBFS_08065 [Aureispira sp.]
MNSKLKTVLIALQIIFTLGTIWFLFFRKKKTESTSSGDLGGPAVKEQKDTNKTDAKQAPLDAKAPKENTAAKSYKKTAKPPVIRPAGVEITQWNPESKAFQYQAVYNGFIVSGEFAPGEAPIDKKLGTGRVIVVQGHDAAYLEQRIVAETLYRAEQDIEILVDTSSTIGTKSGVNSSTKLGARKKMNRTSGSVTKASTIKLKDIDPKTVLGYNKQALDRARKYASHPNNELLLEELANGVHRDFAEFTAQYVTIAIFKEATMSQSALLKFYLLDLSTGKRVLLDGQQ